MQGPCSGEVLVVLTPACVSAYSLGQQRVTNADLSVQRHRVGGTKACFRATVLGLSGIENKQKIHEK